MCGIVAVLASKSTRRAPSVAEVIGALDAAVAVAGSRNPADILAAAGHAELANALLYGRPGVRALVMHSDLDAGVGARIDQLQSWIVDVESWLEANAGVAGLESLNSALVQLKDVVWAVRSDRLRTGRCVADLAGRNAGDAALDGMALVQVALSSLDRLEVRGRDSAGIHLFVTGHGLDTSGATVQAMVAGRAENPLFTSGSVRVEGDALSFVYKAAAEIGELGDNTRALRAAITGDPLLQLALASPLAEVAVLAHTRWASVGIISEPNCHPLNNEEVERPLGVQPGPYMVGALNGDVDNHADLKASHHLHIASPITTDAKVIPTLASRLVQATGDLVEGFRRTVASFDGSVAIGAASAAHTDRLLLALRGSGQALYIGFAEEMFIVASEPYGLVEETRRYLRMDGETPAHPDQPASRGQIIELNSLGAGTLGGIRRIAYDGSELPLAERELVSAEVTTRDIDRGSSPHFLLKEIREAPGSFRKTLRGKIRENNGLLESVLGEATIPADVRAKLASGGFRRIDVIGQGTAAVAGQSMAALLTTVLQETDVFVRPITATEFCGFNMPADLTDTLVVAVSQSGTTTDTNRAVDLARGRGASVIAIVNRRNSDLTDKADGVLYTSDGRDVEMSVASTKAFYAQVAAGALLTCALTEAMGIGDARGRHELLVALRELPDALAKVIELRPQIARAAGDLAPYRRYWAVVGNGPNKVAAEEVRIKLSELCYKSIACDVTEDKKHIDLSSEPLILVCAAGLYGGMADDVAKEVAIYRAHKASPIVVASEGEERFGAALHVIHVPAVDRRLDFVLSAMVGHLFGYEAALSIDALARPLREAREAVELAAQESFDDDDLLTRLKASLVPISQRFHDALRTGIFDGNLEASTAVRMSGLFRDAIAAEPLDAYQASQGKVGTPVQLVDDLTAAITRAIDELTRPIDAIKHQAKTVTVGISRSDEGVMANRIVQGAMTAGASRERVSYSNLRQLAALEPAIAEIIGFTRYRIEGDAATNQATIQIVDRGGISLQLPSRVERNGELRGTKRRIAVDQRVGVARGRNDGRSVVLVPEVKGGQTTGITLLHVALHDTVTAAAARGVLQGFDDRYSRIADTVAETEPTFRDDLLATISVIDLLTVPIADLAERWRS